MWTLEWLFEDDPRCLIQFPDADTVGHAYKIALRALKHQKVDPEREIPTSADEQILEYDIGRRENLEDTNAKVENHSSSKKHLDPQTISVAEAVDNQVAS